MSRTQNIVHLIGNLGKDPEIRRTQSGTRTASFSLATSDSWKDKTTGERRENVQWHRIVVAHDGMAGVAEKFLRKGSKVALVGKIENRKWTDDSGRENTISEILLRAGNGQITLLDNFQPNDDAGPLTEAETAAALDDDIQY